MRKHFFSKKRFLLYDAYMDLIRSRRWLRLAINIALDGALAAAAVILACFLAAPGPVPPDLRALPAAGAVAIWLIGVPFGLSRLHWRFTAMRDLALVGGAGITAAILLVLLLVGAGVALPSPSFPVILALCMVAALTAPRIAYRLARTASRQADDEDLTTAILVGTGETAELFLSALSRFPVPLYRVSGLIFLSSSSPPQNLPATPSPASSPPPNPTPSASCEPPASPPSRRPKPKKSNSSPSPSRTCSTAAR